ncbi:MAG: 2-C-methyl-D-erythritol 4-phosphate cytidylyltransferase [bacterium]
MEKYLLMAAGGMGKRMGAEMPKQFIPLNGIPLLIHTLRSFNFMENLQLVLVLPESLQEEWNKLCNLHEYKVPHQIAPAGPTRYHSVKSGLNLVPDGHLVAIHDGVRPFASQETVRRCFKLAESRGNAIPVVPVGESVRIYRQTSNQSINRQNLVWVQTPQVFHSTLIRKAYRQPYDEHFTDDASVVEKLGETIYLTEGNRENIKITDHFDLMTAENFIIQKARQD